MRRIARKAGTTFVALSTVLWSLGVPLGLLAPRPAMAIDPVTMSQPPAFTGIDGLPPGGPAAPIIAFQLDGNGSDVLERVVIHLKDVNGTLQPADFVAANVWKDVNGDGLLDSLVDQPLAGSGGNGCPVPAFNNDIYGDGTLIVSSLPLSADCVGTAMTHVIPDPATWYFITLRMAPSWGSDPNDSVAVYMFAETADLGDPPGAVQTADGEEFPDYPSQTASSPMRFPSSGGLGLPSAACNSDGTADGTNPLTGGDGEMCDGTDLRSLTCATLPDAPFTGGTLACSSNCTFDVSQCIGGGGGGTSSCGNGAVEYSLGEVCDGVNLGTPAKTCADLPGFTGGTLGCNAYCGWDVSQCTGTSTCGNGSVDAGEQCDDGNNANGDGCNAFCQFEGTGTQCFTQTTDTGCNSTPGCMWDWSQMFCIASDNPCNNWSTTESCTADPGCWWDSAADNGAGLCVMKMGGNYPQHPADVIYTFPQPFDNDSHPLTDGDPYSLDNRPPMMMIGVPRMWTQDMAPLIVGFSEQPQSMVGKITMWRYDDLADSWSDVSSNLSFSSLPSGSEIMGTTLAALDPNTIFRVAVKGATKNSDSSLFDGQHSACPDGSGNLCWHSTFKTGDSLVPTEGYQGGNGDICPTYGTSGACDADPFCNWNSGSSTCESSMTGFGCQAGDVLNWRWPFPNAAEVDPHVMADVESCSGTLSWSGASATFVEMDGSWAPTGATVSANVYGVNPVHQIEPLAPLSPGMNWQLQVDGLTDGGTVAQQTVNFTTGNFMADGMMFGSGRLTVNLISGLDGGNNPIAQNATGTGAAVVVACGNTDMPTMGVPEGPPTPSADAFFMDGFIPAGSNSVTIHGLPTPATYTGGDTNPFENPCLVFLRPDTAGMVMGTSYYVTLPTAVGYSVNSTGTKPLPPMGKYGEVTLADDDDTDPNNAGPNAKTVYLQVATVTAGSLAGAVCIDDDGSGSETACGEGDTKLQGLEVGIFPMAPMTGGDMFQTVMTDGSGAFSFGTLNGGTYQLQVWGFNPATNQNYSYFGQVVINGATTSDIVIGLGNTLDLTLDDTAGCWNTSGQPVHYGFWPTTFGFSTQPVFGEKFQGDFTDNLDSTYTVSLVGFGDGTYNGTVEVPGCTPVKIPAATPPPGAVVFGSSPQALTLTLSAGTTVTGQVCSDADFTGCDSPVADFNFGAHTKFDPSNPMDFGGFVGTRTDGSGAFSLPGLSDGYWVFETWEAEGGTGRSFAAGQGSIAANGSYLVAGDASGLTLYLRQDKRVNITVTDGVNPVTDAMIDIQCDTGKFVHLGHSNGVWTYLPPGDTCRFSVWPRYGGRYQPLENQAVAITAGATPQDVSLTLNSSNDSVGNYSGSTFKADRTTTYPGGTVKYSAKIRAASAADLAGHSVVLNYPDAAVDHTGITASPTSGTCTVTATQVTCPISAGYVDSFFDVYFEVPLETNYTGNSLSASLQINSTPVTIGNVYTEVTQLTINAPSVVQNGEDFKVYGKAYPNATVTLSTINAAGTETTVGTTIMERGSSWYSFDVTGLTTDGTYTLKVEAVAAGSSASKTKELTVGGTTPDITAIQFTTDGRNWSTNSLTGLPSGQIFEGNSFSVAVTFSDTVTSVSGSFLGSLFTLANSSGNTWTVTVPSGWTGYGDATFDISAVYNSDTLSYGSAAEILILIDPSGYIYDTTDANRLEGVTATVYQLVDGSNNTVTFVDGADDGTGGGTASNGVIEDGEELANSGSVLKLDDSSTDCSSDGTTLDGCSWILWDASPSGQVNPQTTDSEGKYGWNVPQGWYRVSFQKTGAYSLSYSRDVYVPPAETQLNLNLGGYDIAAPTVSSVSPANSATGVARNAQPVITFSEPMLASTINTSNIRLLAGGSAVSTTVTYNSSNNTATIAPSSTLLASTTYTVRVTTSVKDDTSNALAATYESTFTTSATADSTAPVSTASVATGTYSTSQTVTLSATDSSVACPDCTIYYTRDGSTPTTSSSVYTSALTVSSTTTLKFFARDAAGNSESPANSRTYTIQVAVPTAPAGLTAGSIPAAVSLNWDDTSGATGYKVYRSLTSGSGYVLVGSPTSSLYADYTANSITTTYYYKVSATNGAGESSLSTEVSASPIAGGGGGGGGSVVTASISLNSLNGGQTLSAGDSQTLTWVASGSGVASIALSWSADGGSTWTDIADGEPNDGSYAWTVPDVTTANARVRVRVASSTGSILATDSSDADFSIVGSGPSETVGESTGDGSGLTSDESSAPAVDPNATGGYSAADASESTPTINLDKDLLEEAEGLLCEAGSLIKAESSTAVYYCGRDGRRYVFPNQQVFFSWFDSFEGIVTMTDSELAQIPLGGNVTHKPGVRMVKIQSDPKTYAVARGGLLRWVQTEEVARALYGDDWNQKIDDVSVAYWVNYQIGEPITPADVGL